MKPPCHYNGSAIHMDSGSAAVLVAFVQCSRNAAILVTFQTHLYNINALHKQRVDSRVRIRHVQQYAC